MEKARTDTVQESGESKEAITEKVYCANCVNCKVVQQPAGANGQYQLRVRCSAGQWRKKLGEEKIYKYFTVARRSQDYCEFYEPMGDPREFIKELKKTLPIKDELYNPSNQLY